MFKLLNAAIHQTVQFSYIFVCHFFVCFLLKLSHYSEMSCKNTGFACWNCWCSLTRPGPTNGRTGMTTLMETKSLQRTKKTLKMCMFILFLFFSLFISVSCHFISFYFSFIILTLQELCCYFQYQKM